MNKEQAKIELLKIIDDHIKRGNEIMQEAKKNGTWKMGLDSNRDLFADLDKEVLEKVNRLKSMIDK